MTARAFCTITASTKRNPAPVAGITTAPIANIVSMLVTPLWPLQPETIAQLDINSPREYKECFHVPTSGDTLPDVKEGDILTVAAIDYPVLYAGEWIDITDGIPTLHMVVQQIKGT